MAGKLSPPEELSFSGNLNENWSRWKKEFEFGFYITAMEARCGKDLRLLTAIGKNEERNRGVLYFHFRK